MAAACEALRLIDSDGLTAEDRERIGANAEGGGSREMGRLYRIAMLKGDVYGEESLWTGVPIEYGRIQTDSPARKGWNHAWTK